MAELILGLNVFGHDSSVSLLDSTNGKILYCLTEERFSNKKHDGKLPIGSIKNILKQIEKENLGQITHVATNLDYSLIFKDYLSFHLSSKIGSKLASQIESAIFDTLPLITVYEMGKYPSTWFAEILFENNIEPQLAEEILLQIGWCMNHALKIRSFNHYLKDIFPLAEFHTVRHHYCHMASVFFTSTFTDAAILTIDGQGESETITLGYAEKNEYTKLSHSIWPHSIGSFYMDITAFLGFLGTLGFPGYGEEYKVMGMAAYGKPTYLPLFRELGHVTADGQFQFIPGPWIRQVSVEGCPGHFKMEFSDAFAKELGGRRTSSEAISQRHFDIAASLQAFIEEIGTQLAKILKQKCPTTSNICISGGVALNGLMNMKILRESGFKNIFVFPASGDDGTSLGAALYVHGIKLKRKVPLEFSNAFLGLKRTNQEIEDTIKQYGLHYHKPTNLSATVASHLADNKIVARYLGCSEFGPRALGHRSILANACSEGMKDILNTRIKHREPFRPFAPVCLFEDAKDYFDINTETPYMLLICQVKPDKKQQIPAVVHNDGTARLQTITKNSTPDLYDIVSEFKKIAGVPVIMNTSYNVNGEAIVETPQDAIEAFLFMDIDYLAIGDFLISKVENPLKPFDMPINEFLAIRKKRYKDEFNSHESFFEPTEFPGSGDTAQLNRLITIYKKAAEERLELINRLDAECKKRDNMLSKIASIKKLIS